MIAAAAKSAARGAHRRWVGMRDHAGVQMALRIFQYAILAGVIGYLAFRLTQVGWLDVLDSLPSSPWFYLFFMLRFLALPISEIAIYEIVWNKPLMRYFSVFVRKRVYNFAVMGYSGEAFLTLWARRELHLSDKTVVVGIKDNNLISAFSSNAATVLLVLILAGTGALNASLNAFPGAAWLFGAAFLTAGTLAVAVMIFRRKLIALPEGVMPKLLSVHAFRQTLIIVLHAAMYAAALPGAPLIAWVTFIALQLVLSRVPFLPNQDIVFLGAALTLSPIVGQPEAAVAGMLVAEAGLSQIINAILFVATAHHAKTAKPQDAAKQN